MLKLHLSIAICFHIIFHPITIGIKENKCGYNSCNVGQSDAINVHFVSHSHDDVGWLKTVEEYYFGQEDQYFTTSVRRIITTVIESLQQNEQRRFIFVEMIYFQMWWNDYARYNETLQYQVRQLINNGRLQFVLGGLSMNDEATTHYQAIIDQHTRGQRFLDEEFGECARPLVAWQIDPFGHSREQANLFQKMGFDALFVWRIDSQDRAERIRNKSLEFIWYGSDDSDDNSPLFTSIMENGYFTPADYCLDLIQCFVMGQDTPVDMDVENMIQHIYQKATVFKTNHILIPIGGDFQFQDANATFDLSDKLIAEINSLSQAGGLTNGTIRKINAFYSTPACYAYAVNQQKSVKFPIKRESDFFPLMETANTVWSGYFTSRPTLKRYISLLNSRLQSVQQFAVMSGFGIKKEIEDAIDVVRRHMGIAQHHDAITGTAKAGVVENYKWLLWQGHEKCVEVMASLMLSTNFYNEEQKDIVGSSCPLLNISHCKITEHGQNVTLIVYNGNSHSQKTWLRFPMPTDETRNVRVFQNNQMISTVYVPVSALPDMGHMDLDKKIERATEEFLFSAVLPPLGYSAFRITFLNTQRMKIEFDQTQSDQAYHVLRNQYLSVSIDKLTGLISGQYKSLQDKSVQFSQTFCVYEPAEAFRPSGAYNFHPTPKDPLCYSKTKSYKIFRSVHVQELHQIFSNNLSQVVRLYSDSKFLEFEWTVGPLPFGKEVTLNYVTPWFNEGEFFTDANCRQRLLRQRNKRDFTPFRQYSPIAGNYYPIDCFISLPSKSTLTNDLGNVDMLTVLTDRAQGGGSIRDGQLEIMVHRKTEWDDELGLFESLEEVNLANQGFVARGKHYVLLADALSSDTLVRQKSQEIFYEPFPVFLSSKNDAKLSLRFSSYLGLSSDIPDQIYISTLDQWKNNTKLLRLEHIYSKDNNLMGFPVKVKIGHLFRTFKIIKIKELLLTGLEPNVNRLVWNSIYLQEIPDEIVSNGKWTAEDFIDMKPMQIRTFQITIRYSFTLF